MAKLDKEQQAYREQLDLLAAAITKRVCTPEYAHMLELWKAFLGGFVGPEIAKLDPDTIDAKRQALIDQYSKEAIQKMLHPDPIEKTVEVEKIVYKDRPAPTSGTAPAPTPSGTDNGNRRYRPTVNKVSRKKREMKAEERQSIIELFNQTQKLMDKDDDACKSLVDDINGRLLAGDPKTYPAQVAGYWSWLCRLVLKPQVDQQKWYSNATRLGKIPSGCPMPVASDEFIKLIVENQSKEKALAAHRQAYKSHMQGAPNGSENKPCTIDY